MADSTSDDPIVKKHPEAKSVLKVFKPPLAIGITGLGLILAGVALLYFTFYVRQGPITSSRSPVSDPGGTVLTILAFASMIVGVILALFGLGSRLIVCEGGVVIGEQQKTTFFPWDDVTGVVYSMQGAVPVLAGLMGRRVALETKEGKSVPAAGWTYRNCFHIAEALLEHVGPKAAAEATRRLDKTLSAQFGKRVLVKLDEIEWDGRPIPWGEVQSVEWRSAGAAQGGVSSDTELALHEPYGAKVIHTSEIPNVPILLDILEKRFKVKVKRSTGGFF